MNVWHVGAYTQGIDVRSEPHLLWIAKLAVLEIVPEGWEEYQDATGRTLYKNLHKGCVFATPRIMIHMY